MAPSGRITDVGNGTGALAIHGAGSLQGPCGVHSARTARKPSAPRVSAPQLVGREVVGGELPPATVGSFGLQATLVDQTLYVSGGYTTPDFDYRTSILSWDPVAESWQSAGSLLFGRGLHATVAIPRSTIAMYCKQKD